MRLLIIRHADPDYENNTITEAGHIESKSLAVRLKKEKITDIVCSPLQRAIDTMNYTRVLTGVSPIFYDWLMEFEWTDLVNGYKNPWDIPGDELLKFNQSFILDEWRSIPCFDGEKVFNDYLERTKQFDSFLSELGYIRNGLIYKETVYSEKNIAIFCHAGLGTALLSHLLNIPLPLAWAHFWLAPTSVTTVVFNKRDSSFVVPKCVSFGDTSHLYSDNIEIKFRGYKGNKY